MIELIDMIQAIRKAKNVSYQELETRLTARGIDISVKQLSNRFQTRNLSTELAEHILFALGIEKITLSGPGLDFSYELLNQTKTK